MHRLTDEEENNISSSCSRWEDLHCGARLKQFEFDSPTVHQAWIIELLLKLI